MVSIRWGLHSIKEGRGEQNFRDKQFSNVAQLDRYLMVYPICYLFFEIVDGETIYKFTYQYNRWCDGFLITCDYKGKIKKSVRILGHVKYISEEHIFPEYEAVLGLIFDCITFATEPGEYELPEPIAIILSYFRDTMEYVGCWEMLSYNNHKWVSVSEYPMIKHRESKERKNERTKTNPITIVDAE